MKEKSNKQLITILIDCVLRVLDTEEPHWDHKGALQRLEEVKKEVLQRMK